VEQRSNGQYLLTKAASVSSTSTLDLTSNDLIVDYATNLPTSPLGAVTSSIKTGFNNGSWNGKGIITSPGQSDGRVALGYAEASALLGLSGTAKGTFDGQSVDATTVLVKYTYYGDADLSGNVTLDDFTQFLDGYQHAGTDWLHGDFDYSGNVTVDDFTQFLYGYQNQGASLGALSSELVAAGMSSTDRAVLLAAVEAVPEPTEVTVLALAAAAAVGSRRSRRLRA
jgi:hypothetical protein